MSSARTPDDDTLGGYRSVGDVTFNLDGTASTDLGWVLFEIVSSDPDTARGIIGTYNHYATLQLMRTFQTQRPCHIYGEFEDGVNVSRAWALHDVVSTVLDVYDVSGFVAFRAAALMEPPR